jgi:hypothetical protein
MNSTLTKGLTGGRRISIREWGKGEPAGEGRDSARPLTSNGENYASSEEEDDAKARAKY